MEIKKYVLTETWQGKIILNCLKENYYINNERLHFSMIDENTTTLNENKIIKTSDNILDLVEVGDLVEMDNDWEILKVLRFNKNNQMVCMVRTSSTTEEYTFKDYRKEWIIAIYKKQPNGDFKKYEVKEK